MEKRVFLLIIFACLLVFFFILWKRNHSERNLSEAYHRILKEAGLSGRPHLTELGGIHSEKTAAVEDIYEAEKVIKTESLSGSLSYFTSQDETETLEINIRKILANAQKIEIHYFGEEQRKKIQLTQPETLQTLAENFNLRSNVKIAFPQSPPHSIGMTMANVSPTNLSFACERGKIWMWGDSFQIGEAEIDPTFTEYFFESISALGQTTMSDTEKSVSAPFTDENSETE